MTRADEIELEWWRHFYCRNAFGSELPRVGVAMIGHDYVVIRDDHPLFEQARQTSIDSDRHTLKATS